MDQVADTSPQSASNNTDGDHDSGVDETTQGKNVPTTNGDLGSPNKSPSKIPAPKRLSMPSPTKSTKGSPKTPETPPTAEKKKVPMNKVQVGAAPSPNLKTVRSKIGSLENTSYKPGGGKVKIENRKVDFSHAQPRIAAKNDTYTPGGGDKKITQVKLAWNAKSKIGSLENAAHKPGGGDKKIESMKLDFKDKAKPKIGSKDNIKHQPGGGAVKSSDDGTQDDHQGDIEEHRLDIKAESKVGSMDNVKHKPGGGDKKIFDDKDYIKQTSKAGSEGIASGTQIEDGYCSSNTSRKTSRDRRQTSETRGERQRTPTSAKSSPNEEVKHKSLIEKHIEKQKQNDSVENGVENKNKTKKLDKKQTEPSTNGIEHAADEIKESIVEEAIKEESGTLDAESKEEKQTQLKVEQVKILNGTSDTNLEKETSVRQGQKEENGSIEEGEKPKTIQQKTDFRDNEKEKEINTETLNGGTNEQHIADCQSEKKSEPEGETIGQAESASALELIKENTVSENSKEEKGNKELLLKQKNGKNLKEQKTESLTEVNEVQQNFTENKDVEDKRMSQQSSPLEQDAIEDAEETDHNSNQTNGDGQSEEVDDVIKVEHNTKHDEDIPVDSKTEISDQEINLTDDDKKLSEETEPKNKTESVSEINKKSEQKNLEIKKPEEKIDQNEIVGKNESNETGKQNTKVPSEPAEMTEIERIVLAVAAKLREDEENERIRLDDIIAANKENSTKENTQKVEESNKTIILTEKSKVEESHEKPKEDVEQETLDIKSHNTDSLNTITENTTNLDKNIENSTKDDLKETVGENLVNKSTKEQKAQEEKEIDSKDIGNENKTGNQRVESEQIQNIDTNQVQKVEDKIKQSTQFDTNIIKTLEVIATENQNKIDKENTNVELIDESGKSKSNEMNSAVAVNCSRPTTTKTEIPSNTSENQTSVPSSQGKSIELV